MASASRVVSLLYQEIALVAAEQAAYALSDLINLKPPKAAQLESFLSSWFLCLSQIAVLPADDVLASLLHTQVEHLSTLLSTELEKYEKADRDEKAKSY